MGGDLRESVFVYIDDLLIVSPDFDSHISKLKVVADKLRKANLTINVNKSKFVMREIRYLGYIVGNGQLKTDPEKISAITNFPIPKTVRQVRRFLGMTGWYQRFIQNYSAVAAPMTDLVGKKGVFVWPEAADDSFNQLKKCLSSAPVLNQPDFTKPFFIQCDASIVGVGSVLFQLSDDGEEHPIAFHSKKLNSAQRKYSVTELECYAAVLSVKHFRAYVELMPFTIITDHASLKWLMGQKDLGGRLGRWSLKLQSYNFDIQHRKGTANVVPDTLSRMYVDELVTSDTGVALFLDLSSTHFDSSEYAERRALIRSLPSSFPDLRLVGRHIYHKHLPREGAFLSDESCWKLWVPKELTATTIERAHDAPMSAHRGVEKTIELLRRNFFWPGLARQTREYVIKCQTCKETKAPNQILRPVMGKQFHADRPWQMIYTDLLGPYPRSTLGNTHLLIVLDQFSKFVLIHPLRKANSTSIIRFLHSSVFNLFGVPETLLSDNGVQYTSRKFKDFLDKYRVNHVRTAIYSPQANASERVNRSILSAIRVRIGTDQRNWDREINEISAALRNTVHASTKFTPFFLVFGYHMVQHGTVYEMLRKIGSIGTSEVDVLPSVDFRDVINGQVRVNLDQAHERHERSYNTRAREVNFAVGQEVYRRVFAQSDFTKNFNAKLGKKWVKARVVRKLGTAMYELSDMNGKVLTQNYHAKDIKQ